jgi:hypothetical protein
MVVTVQNSRRYKRYVDFMKSIPQPARGLVKESFGCTDTYTMKDVVLWSREDLLGMAAEFDFGFGVDELDTALDALEIRLNAMGLSLRRHDEKARKIGSKHGSSLREPDCPPRRDPLSYYLGYLQAVEHMNEKYIKRSFWREFRDFWSRIKPPQID